MEPDTKLDEALRQAARDWRAALPAPNADLAQVRSAATPRADGGRWTLVIAAAAAVVVLTVTLFTRLGQTPDSLIAAPTPPSPTQSTAVATGPGAPSTRAGTSADGPPPAACTGTSFAAGQNYAQVAHLAGRTWLQLQLRNVSGQPCLLNGFATLSMTPSDGRAITLWTSQVPEPGFQTTSGLLGPGEFGEVDLMYTPVDDAHPHCVTSAPARTPTLPAVITVGLAEGDTKVPLSAAIADDPTLPGVLAGCTGLQFMAGRSLDQTYLPDAARGPDQVVVDFYAAIGRGDIAAAQSKLSAEHGGPAAVADPAWLRNFTSVTNIRATVLKQDVDPALFHYMSHVVQVGVTYDAQVREVLAEGSGTHYRFVYVGRPSGHDPWRILQIATGP